MKRLGLDSFITSEIERYDIKPSQLRRIETTLFRHNLSRVERICCTTEQKLLKLDGFDKDIVDVVKEILGEHGLSLGMTEEELTAYEDAEYYTRHPEEKGSDKSHQENDVMSDELLDIEPIVDPAANHLKPDELEKMLNRSPLKQHISDETEENQKPPVPPLTDILRRRIIRHYDQNVRKDLRNKLTDRAFIKMSIEDIEFIRLHLFRAFLMCQPWYASLIWSKEKRIAIAKEDAKKACEEYVNNLIDAFAERDITDLSENIDSQWENNWERYMKDLQKE